MRGLTMAASTAKEVQQLSVRDWDYMPLGALVLITVARCVNWRAVCRTPARWFRRPSLVL